MLTRREAIGTLLAAGLAGTVASCARRSSQEDGSIVVYTSVDDFIAQQVVTAARQSSLNIRVVTDTEATKTTGLLERLSGERASPVCDVWWSNEALATVQLAASGVLVPFPASAEPADMPAGFGGTHWRGCALRTRVIAYHTNVLDAGLVASLERVAGIVRPGRLAMAQPQFGTTRGHVAALVAAWGAERTEAWLAGLRERNVRVLPGNSAVVRAIASGEVDAGLTDSDDVFVGQREGWKVGFLPGSTLEEGRLAIPCTVGLTGRGGVARQERASEVASFLLGAQTERLLAASEAVHRPLRESLAAVLEQADPRLGLVRAEWADWEVIGRAREEASRLIERYFPA